MEHVILYDRLSKAHVLIKTSEIKIAMSSYTPGYTKIYTMTEKGPSLIIDAKIKFETLCEKLKAVDYSKEEDGNK